MPNTLDVTKLGLNLAKQLDLLDWERINILFPKNTICPTCRGTGYYISNQLDIECNCELQKMLTRAYYGANIPKAYHTLDYIDFTSEDKIVLITAIDDYVDKIEHYLHNGIGLTFSGGLGTGKTMAACILCKETVKMGYSTYFIPFNDLIHAWANKWNNDEAKWLDTKLRSVDFLTIDELITDSRNHSGFLTNALESIIRFRASNNKPTIITTNLSSGMEKSTFRKSFSLLSACNKRIETQGKDFRIDEMRRIKFDLVESGESRPVV